jgi:tRNA A-37 threonylcarbamoyl transferase component Bud32
MIGSTIGKYRIVAQIGRGATGIVYRAVDETLGRDVAIKVLHADVTDAEIMRRFRAEATTLARLNHPDIATIYELLPSDADLLLIMEFVNGETLEQLSTRVGAMPAERAADLTGRILAALDHAHRAGIVHRDMKPANVMVTPAGSIKIMDFGTARVRGAEHMTIDGSVLGTPAYMAPEQVLGRDVDGRADLYSVGVVFYRLLTGALPFEADTPIAMMQRQLSELPVPVHARRSDLPRWCEDVLERALAKAPSDRFQTAEEFRRALEPAAQADADEQHRAGNSASPVADGIQLVRRRVSAAGARWILSAAAAATLVAYLALRGGGELMSAGPLPPLAFETTAVVDIDGAQRERDVVMMLADRTITLTGSDSERPLYSLPFTSVVSISFARGRDPMWNSPDGPRRAARPRGGALGKLGIFPDRNWITLRTDTADSFLIVRTRDEQVETLLNALEQRTGRTPERVTGAPTH